ncbi:MAG: SpoIID/LytB domain-containing protein [Bacillota bacterium]|nr:SpoIID/LytB domain-containing protein [Bacillota bacterium]
MSENRKNVRRFVPLLLVIVLLAVYIASCQMRNARVDPPTDGSDAPEIPEQIDRGERQEPVLTVFIAERNTVVEMPMEEYIAGVVAGEMDPKWPVEALAAQAILARTFTMQKIAETGGVPHRNAHASTDIEEFQAYSAADITDRVREAVRVTRGEVACYDNNFIWAWFNAFAGPRTAHADEGLAFEGGNPPYIHSVESPGEEIIPEEEGSWAASFTLDQVRRSVTEMTGQDPGVVQSVEIEETGPSGRAAFFRVNDQIISGPGLRLSLGSTEMRSTFVEELNIEGGSLKMNGTGYGHGVGLCQWGARAMAEEGNSPEEIVHYFYRDIDIISLWD